MDDKEYLELELGGYRETEQQRIDDEMEAREQRREEAKERYEAALRTADTWPEALRKQRDLMTREIELDDVEGKFGEPDTFFGDSVDACTRALKLWHEISPTKNERRADLKAQIKQLQKVLETIDSEVAQEVGELLLTERGETDLKPMDGWRTIANTMINGVAFDAWLDW
jgi:septal ring factor EnvC (AmiA/AmiB activator)